MYRRREQGRTSQKPPTEFPSQITNDNGSEQPNQVGDYTRPVQVSR